jgi:hypothetical protein
MNSSRLRQIGEFGPPQSRWIRGSQRVGRDEIGRVAMDGAGPIAILDAPAGPPGHLPASAGLRQPQDLQAISDARVLVTRIKGLRSPR